MKKQLIIVLALAGQVAVFAQSSLQVDDGRYAVVRPGNYKEQVMQYRLTTILAETYDLGLYEKTDSIYYVYDPELPYGHGNFDFLEATNFTSEPLYYLSEWLDYTGDAWQGYYKYYNNFNDDDQRTSTNIDEWDGVSYVGSSRVEYSYNEDGLVDTILYLDYAGGDYDSLYRHIYTYSGGQLANIVWEDYGTEWENDFLLIYTFTAEGLIDNIVFRNWDGDSWYDEGRYLYSYDPDGNIIENLIQDYDFGWVTDGRYIYSYDANDFNYIVEIQGYDGVDYISMQRFDLVEFENGLPAMNSVSYWDGFIWDPSSRIHFWYESYDDGTINIDDVTQSFNLNIYPNPVAGQFTISFTSGGQQHVSLLITDASGKPVNRQTFIAFPGQNEIQKDLGNTLPSGFYQAILIIDGAQIVKSFVVE